MASTTPNSADQSPETPSSCNRGDAGTNITALEQEAEVFLAKQDLFVARDIYVKLCEQAPDYADGWLMLGAVDEQLGLIEDAVRYVGRGLQLDPETPEPHLMLSGLLWRMGRLPTAYRHARKAVSLDPEYIEAQLHLIELQHKRDWHDKVLSTWRRASSYSDAPSLKSSAYVALSMVACGEQGQARQYIEQWIECGDNIDQAHYVSALIARKEGHPAAALRSIDKALDYNPNHTEAKFLHAVFREKAPDARSAHDFIRKNYDDLCSTYDHVWSSTTNQLHRECKKLLRDLLGDHRPTLILDAGCGTGLTGRHLRRRNWIISGVDLSRGMLNKAASSTAYQALIEHDAASFMAMMPDYYDVIIAIDMLADQCKLDGLFGDAWNALSPGGLFMFSVHVTDCVGNWCFNEAGRFSHSRHYIEELCQAGHWLRVEAETLERSTVVYVLKKPGKQRRSLPSTSTLTPSLPPRARGANYLTQAWKAWSRGDIPRARDIACRALKINEHCTDMIFLVGFIAQSRSEFDEAIEKYRRCIEIEPDHASAWFQLGTLYQTRQDYENAEDCYHKAIALEPNLVAAYMNLGYAKGQQGKIEEAAALHMQAVARDPGRGGDLVTLYTLQLPTTVSSDHSSTRGTALHVKPAPEFHVLRGIMLRDVGRFSEAVCELEQAVRLRPESGDAQVQLAIAHQKAGDLTKARRLLDSWIQEHPDDWKAHDALAGVVAATGDVSAAYPIWDRAASLAPPSAGPPMNRLFMLNYSPEISAADLAREHTRWGRALETELSEPESGFANDRNPERILRIGYVSGDFGGHSVAYFLEPILSWHDRRRVEVYCYSNIRREDALTARLRYLSDHWRRITHSSDDDAAARVREDRIDILVDLSGHTGGNRLHLFARRPAPVQVTYLGYANTTGLRAMDYRLTDPLADPPGETDSLHTERLVRLPETFLCYQPPLQAPSVRWAAQPGREQFTFGCFNNPYKITGEVVKIWSRIMHQVPGSRLLLKSNAYQLAETREYFHGLFEAQGIESHRVHTVEFLGQVDHLELYNRVDVGLDPFPYNGTTTTCEALWMGVPVVVMAGERHAARVGVSLLTSSGLEDLIAGNHDEYVRIATAMAWDRTHSGRIRAQLRTRLARSPLLTPKRFTSSLERAYRQMWRRWCAGN